MAGGRKLRMSRSQELAHRRGSEAGRAEKGGHGRPCIAETPTIEEASERAETSRRGPRAGGDSNERRGLRAGGDFKKRPPSRRRLQRKKGLRAGGDFNERRDPRAGRNPRAGLNCEDATPGAGPVKTRRQQEQELLEKGENQRGRDACPKRKNDEEEDARRERDACPKREKTEAEETPAGRGRTTKKKRRLSEEEGTPNRRGRDARRGRTAKRKRRLPEEEGTPNRRGRDA